MCGFRGGAPRTVVRTLDPIHTRPRHPLRSPPPFSRPTGVSCVGKNPHQTAFPIPTARSALRSSFGFKGPYLTNSASSAWSTHTQCGLHTQLAHALDFPSNALGLDLSQGQPRLQGPGLLGSGLGRLELGLKCRGKRTESIWNPCVSLPHFVPRCRMV